MAEWLDMARDAYAHQVPLKPGAGEFLARRAGEGADMALVTACVPELCRAALARHGLERYFSVVVYVQELGVEKRDPRAFALILERLGVRASDCTLYEDSPGACKAARDTGITVVGVYDPFYAMYEAEMRQLCRRYIRSFTELL